MTIVKPAFGGDTSSANTCLSESSDPFFNGTEAMRPTRSSALLAEMVSTDGSAATRTVRRSSRVSAWYMGTSWARASTSTRLPAET